MTLITSRASCDAKKANFSQQKVIVDKNPCNRHDIIVEINGKTSFPNNYNLDQDPKEIFGGFLNQELLKFCPPKSQSLEMPTALENCINYHNWTHTNESTEIFVQIKEPKFPKVTSEEVVNLSFRVDCATSSGISEIQVVSLIVVILALIGFFVLVITIYMLMKCASKDKTSEPEEHHEINEMYGQYEFDEADGTVIRLGSIWVKDKSPQYGETEQANVCRQLSQVQVKDNNPEYDSVENQS